MAKDFAEIERMEAEAGLQATDGELTSEAKQSLTSRFVAQWEKKNARRAIRGGVVSTMALTLAACGDDDDDPDDSDPDTTPTAQTFTLTTGIDAGKDFTGGSGDDTFVGDKGTTSAADSVDGGGGTDTLRIVGTDTLPAMSNIETLILENTNTTATVARDLSSTDLSGVTTLTLDGFEAADGGTTYTVKAGDVINLIDGLDASDGSDDDLDITAAKAVTAATVGVNNSGTSSADMELDFIGAGITDVTLNATGKKSFVDIESSAGGTLKKLTINATSDITITDVDDATTITAVGSAGDVDLSTDTNKVTVTGGDGADKVTLAHAATVAFEGAVNLGKGKDTLVIKNLNGKADLVDNKATIDGGAGDDTLSMVSDLAVSLSTLSASAYAKKGISNFEKITISDATGDGDTIDFSLLGFSDIDFADATQAGTFTVADQSTIEFSKDAAAGGDNHVVTVKGAAEAGSNDDQLALTLNGTFADGTTDEVFAKVTAAAVETVTVKSTATNVDTVTTAVNDLDLVAADAETITVTGDVALDLSNAKFDGVVKTFDASAFTGASLKASFDGGSFGVTATTGETKATLTGSSKADKFTTGGEADTITGGNGIDVITTGGGADTIDLNSITSTANRDVIKDFDVDKDEIEIGATETSDGTSATDAAVVTTVGSKSTTYSLADSDVIEFTFDIAASADLSAATDGAELVKGLSDTSGTDATLSVDDNNDKLYIIAYDGGDAFLYYADESNTTDTNKALAEADISLVATFENVAAGTLDASNVDLV